MASDCYQLTQTGPAPRAAYIHVPFCRHHCGYCNFTVLSGRDDLIDVYLQAVSRELSWLGGPHAIDTLFVGGGTPTHLDLARLERLLEAIRATFDFSPQHEFTVEANPADVHQRQVALLKAAGVTRVSLGAQSFDADKLRRLERDHDAPRILAAVDLLRHHELHVSLDLIFAVPGESLAVWQRDLQQALDLSPEHLSTYGLTLERGTRFYNALLHGQLHPTNEELERDMYELAIDTLMGAGLVHYEVSNFARPGHRCRHNEVYWTGGQYFGAGPGAARFVAGRRETNHRSTTTYLRRVLAGQSPTAECDCLDEQQRARERLVFGLRRMEGVARIEFRQETGFDLDQLGGAPLQRFLAQGLLEDTGSHLRLTREGLMLSDALWPDLIL